MPRPYSITMMTRNRRNLVVFTLALIGILLVAAVARRWLLPQTITTPRNMVVTQAYELSNSIDDSLVVVADTIRLNPGSRAGGDAALIGRGSVRVEGQVDGSLTVMSDTLEIGKSSRISGDVSFMGSRIVVEGSVTGNVTAAGQAMAVSGQIAGTVTACVNTQDIAGAVRPEQVRPCSENEALGFFAPLQPLRASLTGTGIPAATLLWTLPGALALVALAGLMVTVLPHRFSRIQETFYTGPGGLLRTGLMLMLLALGLAGIFILLLALVPSVGLILLPIGLLLALAVIVMALFGWATLALLIGSRLLDRQRNSTLPPLVSALAGSVVLCLLVYLLALVPYGTLALLIGIGGLAVVGLGAMFTTRLNRIRARRGYAT